MGELVRFDGEDGAFMCVGGCRKTLSRFASEVIAAGMGQRLV